MHQINMAVGDGGAVHMPPKEAVRADTASTIENAGRQEASGENMQCITEQPLAHGSTSTGKLGKVHTKDVMYQKDNELCIGKQSERSVRWGSLCLALYAQRCMLDQEYVQCRNYMEGAI